MSKIKVENNFVWILLAAIKIYSTNFLKFTGYMLFPVFGQILGLLLIITLAGLYTLYLPELALKYPAFKDPSTVLLCVIGITVPGMLIFMKAFWDYLVAYGALNSITDGFLSTGKIYDFQAHRETVTQYTFKYIGLWFLYSIFWLVAIFPLFWVIGAFCFIYFILIFQVFTFEPELTPSEYFKRSFELIHGNAFRTLLIMITIGVFTHILFVQGISVFFDFTKLTYALSTVFEKTIVGYIPIETINETMLNLNPMFDVITPAKISNFLVLQIVSFIVIGFTLPLRSVTWTLWYKALSEDTAAKTQKTKTYKKGGKKVVKKLDPEIIKRATRKYDD